MSYPLLDAFWEISDRISPAAHVLLCVSLDDVWTFTDHNRRSGLLDRELTKVLRSLAERSQLTIAVISRRNRALLQARLMLPGVIYAGNHGLEISAPGTIFVQPSAAAASASLTQLAEELRRALQPVTSVDVVDEGLSLSVRYHMAAPEQWNDVQRITHEVCRHHRVRWETMDGEATIDLQPVAPWSRGIAVSWMLQAIDRPDALVIYAGDAAMDEEAFATHVEGVTIRVGCAAWSAAHYSVADATELLRFLEWLDARLGAKNCATHAV